MNAMGLQNRLLYISLIPALFLGLLALGWFTWSDIQHQQQAFKERSEVVANRLADTLSLPVAQADTALLDALIRRALSEQDARSIRLYNASASEWLVSGPNPIGPTDPFAIAATRVTRLYTSHASYRFLAPIIAPRDIQLRTPNPRPIAWVESEFDYAHTRVGHYQAILLNLALLLATLFIISGIAFYLNRAIIRPVHHMIRTVIEIREGNLESRVPTHSKGELRELEVGINAMAETIKDAYNEMQNSVEQATLDLRETLETIEIQNIELDMARRDAQQANQVKTEFLANMSHEIRTPLNGILGFARLLGRSNLSKKQGDQVATIVSSSQVLLSIINDVLDFCKIEAGKLTLDNRSSNLRIAIEEVLAMLNPASCAKNLEVVSLFYNDVPEQLIFDPLRLKQVLTNLISNAIKFTTNGSVVVRTMIEQHQGHKVTVRMSVTDTGIGLTKKQQKALFQAFSQADSSTAREFGGTGLGLAISKRLVEQMGGDIGLESQKDKGSTFWFNIRADVAPAAQQAPTLTALVGLTVAVVEQRELSRLAFRHQFEGWGAMTFELNTPAELLAHLEQNLSPRPTIAVIVLAQPQTDDQLYPALLQIERDLSCPALVIAHGADETIGARLVEQGHQFCLTSPVRNNDLYQTLKQMIRANIDEPSSKPPLHLCHLESPIRVLAVDDNAANLKLIVTLLEDMGVAVDAAGGGEEALHKAQAQAYDLILMDIQMPTMDGLSATRQIRKIEIKPQRVPIVALTAHALADEREAMLMAGMDDYLAKPIDEDQLHKTLLKWTGVTILTPQNPLERAHQPAARLKPMVVAEQPVVDLVSGLQKANGKLDLAKDMLTMLADSLSNDQAQINLLYHQGDLIALQERVHRLHGATLYCGLPRLQMALRHAEQLLKQEHRSGLDDALVMLNQEIGNVARWVGENDVDRGFERALTVYAHRLNASAKTMPTP